MASGTEHTTAVDEGIISDWRVHASYGSVSALANDDRVKSDMGIASSDIQVRKRGRRRSRYFVGEKRKAGAKGWKMG